MKAPPKRSSTYFLDWKDGKVISSFIGTEPKIRYDGVGGRAGPVVWEHHFRGNSNVFFPSRLVPKCSASFDWEPEKWGPKETIVYVSPLLAVQLKHFLKDHL